MKKKSAGQKEKLTPVAQLWQKPKDFLIAGIGASASGIQALQEFFRQVPLDSNLAYVVILHLSPDHDSQLAVVLEQVTELPVLQVTEKTVIELDHIYVVPPDRHLIIEDDYIAVLPNLNLEDSMGTVQIVEKAEKRPEAQQLALRDIFTQLKACTGHDFINSSTSRSRSVNFTSVISKAFSVITGNAATAFNIVKYLGGAYLIYLGTMKLFARESIMTTNLGLFRSQT